jgi:Ni,Fe-hydrogenase III large subunit
MTANEIPFAKMANCGSLPLSSLPSFSPDELARITRECIGLGLRISAYFAAPAQKGAAGAASGAELFIVLADDERNALYAGRAKVEGGFFPSIAEACPQAQLFEREIAEQFGLKPEGHPWLKPVRYAKPWSGRAPWSAEDGSLPAPGTGDFYRVEGESVHEVAVGPVHAGVIEPGHFRFQCHGERVFHLEIALGYQHRGVEEALVGGPDKRSIHYAETAAGDETIAHATSYCQVVEALSGLRRSARAQALGAIALELERLACHIGDLGAIAGDVGFLPTSSYCGRIRGDFLNMTALLCGNRFGRNLLVPGGLRLDMDRERIAELERRLEKGEADASNAIDLMWNTQSVLARLEDTGRLSREAAFELGVVGPAARASGLARDVRYDQSSGIYRMAQVPVSTCDSGDALGRAFVRSLEIQKSIAFIKEQLASLPGGDVSLPGGGVSPQGAAGGASVSHNALASLAPATLAVSLTEGWRGEVCHVAITDEKGAFARYKIVDPSFHNWPALAFALRDQEISDFPLCNKSFNLSYCGHDL